MENELTYTEQIWNQLTAFSKKEELKVQLWGEIISFYSEPYRFYHTIDHVAELMRWSEKYLKNLESPAVVGFAILYHDIFYDTFKDDNEEESATKAREHLQKLQVKPAVIDKVAAYILATKTHTVPEGFEQDKDLLFFLDFDMAILGTGWDDYENYSKKIRREYRQYPDELYNAGRKNALEKMHEKDTLYFTDELKALLNEPAHNNLFREIQMLS